MAAPNSTPIPATPWPSAPAGEDIQDLKPLVDIPYDWDWEWWTLAALAVAAFGFWAWRRWRKKQTEATKVPIIPPHVRAKRKLAEALSLLDDAKRFCIAVSDALRVYLEERFNYRAPERTTEEFLIELQAATALYPDQKQTLAEFLERCDLVKFAKHEPMETELRELHESALRLVDETQFDSVAANQAADTRDRAPRPQPPASETPNPLPGIRNPS